jgi:hypothetical protein
MTKARQRARFFMPAVYRQSAGNSNPAEHGFLDKGFWTPLRNESAE